MGSRKFVKRDHEFSVISRKNFGVAAALEKRAALRSVFPLRRRRNKVIFARGYKHCVFCTDTITTRDHRVCYCSEQDDEWICESFYKDFKELFGWKLEED